MSFSRSTARIWFLARTIWAITRWRRMISDRQARTSTCGTCTGGTMSSSSSLASFCGVDAVVLAFGAVDQPQLGRVGDGDVVGQRPQLLVEVAVAAGRLVADAEGLVELPQPIDDRRPRALDLNLD